MLFPDTATTIASFKPALEKVLRPIEEARGLPAGCYTDDAWLRFESQALFARQWSAACFATDLPVDGSAFPVVLAGMPLVAVRDRDATIRVFHNFCRHRGMRLVTGSQQGVGGLRCPYHSWSYKLNGDLAQTPKFGGEDTNTHPCFNKKDFGLIEVASTVWCGIVFVDVSGQAGAFADRVAQLDKRWHQIVENEVYYPRGDSSFELAVESNWKLAVENYCESYHLPWVHPGLSSYSTLADHYHLRDEGGAFAGQGTVRYAPMLDETGLRFPSLEGLDAFWDEGAEYAALFPNVLLGAHRDSFFAIILLPDGASRTVERVHLGYFDEAVTAEKYANIRTRAAAMWKEIFQEDVFAVQGMQQGRQSPAFDGGVFSPVMDNPTHDFHQWTATIALRNVATAEAA
ncbi:MAG: aromatic ring-hydroxylating dioxygenase subunit alpha [Alphaproteobacteria bacterium]|nr:aromatic ring-hydroxylating dioxygenase subunit alpha [Alphaproteobacteria bacterium]